MKTEDCRRELAVRWAYIRGKKRVGFYSTRQFCRRICGVVDLMRAVWSSPAVLDCLCVRYTYRTGWEG